MYNCVCCFKLKFTRLLAGICEYFTSGRGQPGLLGRYPWLAILTEPIRQPWNSPFNRHTYQIGSFSVVILQYRPFRRGRVFLFWGKAGNSKFATKTAKKVWRMSFFKAKLPEKAKRIEILPRFQRLVKKTNILRASFIILKIWKRLMQKLKQASPKTRRT